MISHRSLRSLFPSKVNRVIIEVIAVYITADIKNATHVLEEICSKCLIPIQTVKDSTVEATYCRYTG